VTSVSNWETLWIALAGGAVGSILTALIAYGAKFWAARSEIAAHDRAARERDQDLESWMADRSRVLRRFELSGHVMTGRTYSTKHKLPTRRGELGPRQGLRLKGATRAKGGITPPGFTDHTTDHTSLEAERRSPRVA
jgi:hypothetical protein